MQTLRWLRWATLVLTSALNCKAGDEDALDGAAAQPSMADASVGANDAPGAPPPTDTAGADRGARDTPSTARDTARPDGKQVGPPLLPVPTDSDFAIQGEYAGQVTRAGGAKVGLGAQVIGVGNGAFRAVFEPGGLPGAGWDKRSKITVDGRVSNGKAVFDPSTDIGQDFDTGGSPGGYRASVTNGIMTGTTDAGESFELKHVVRESPTLGMPAPPGAVVIFDGTNTDAFIHGSGYAPGAGKMTADGLITNDGAQTRRTFTNFFLHVELRVPYDPRGAIGGRGNGGIYLQGRYEIQVLDSLGLRGTRSECGGIWALRDPDLNMAFGPLSFQTFDVDFTAARYQGGNKVANARATIRFNGVVIHDDIDLPQATDTPAIPEGPEPGPLYLQNHPYDVRYRNIWIVEK